ncbi:hypothetical protein AB0J52_42085, partial [Spirillospora sp. NPDC049652]
MTISTARPDPLRIAASSSFFERGKTALSVITLRYKALGAGNKYLKVDGFKRDGTMRRHGRLRAGLITGAALAGIAGLAVTSRLLSPLSIAPGGP